MKPSRWPRALVLVLAGAAIGIFIYWVLPKPRAGGEAQSTQQSPSEGVRPASVTDASPINPSPNASSNVMIDPKLAAALDELWSGLNSGMSPDQVRAALQELAGNVEAMDPSLAARTLIAFLQGGKDAQTGLGFRVSSKGTLEESPSLRVAALDMLGRTGAPDAVRYGETILNDTDVADEYAVALRNLAWAGGDATAARDRFSGMLDRDDWIEKPSAGFMEAFDVAVASGGARMVREIGAVVLGKDDLPEGDRATLNQPAFVALDRLMARDPLAVVQTFADDPEFLSWAPDQRASVVSRADIRDAGQKAMLESYLTKTRHAPGELEYFANIFPNVNGLDGNRMVTESDEIRDVQAIDAATLETLRVWQVDPRFQQVSPAIKRITDRLGNFVKP